MSKFLASVNSLEEARLVNAIGVDIIDLKQPAQGALGALDSPTIRDIVAQFGEKTPISATIGDLPMQPETLANAVNAMSALGVDYIKLGFFPGGDWLKCLSALTPLCAQNNALIAVLFADTAPPLPFIESLKAAGFRGVMLDTMDKTRGSLTKVMSHSQIAQFVSTAQQFNLLCGLAGSLKMTDIPTLIELQPDYLGFRGALCKEQQRTASLNQDAVFNIWQALN